MPKPRISTYLQAYKDCFSALFHRGWRAAESWLSLQSQKPVHCRKHPCKFVNQGIMPRARLPPIRSISGSTCDSDSFEKDSCTQSLLPLSNHQVSGRTVEDAGLDYHEICRSSLSWLRPTYSRAVRGLALVGLLVTVHTASAYARPWYDLYKDPVRQNILDMSSIQCAEAPLQFDGWYQWPLGHYNDDTLAYTPPVTSEANSRIGLVQICTYAKKSWVLEMLLNNHRDYAKAHGSRYILKSGGSLGKRQKPGQMRRIIEEELVKPEDQRLEWLFFNDIDTIITNPSIEPSTFLPPRGSAQQLWLIISKDLFGLNSGVYFIRVDQRSVDFLLATENVPKHPDPLKGEQPAVTQLTEQWELEAKGEMVFLDQRYFNSYECEAGYTEVKDTFQIHFPSLSLKEERMLPMMRDIWAGHRQQDTSAFEPGRAIVKSAMQAFWKEHSAFQNTTTPAP